MKQKELNENQKEIVARLKDVFEEATKAGVDFIFDTADKSLTAFNNENEGRICFVCFDNGENFDWEHTEIIYGDFWNCCSSYYHVYIDYNE